MKNMILVCACGEKLDISDFSLEYKCPKCGIIYFKDWYLEGGEYKFNIERKEKLNVG